ncbi:spore coat protein [Natronospora cellulosivora (SeqCode)]
MYIKNEKTQNIYEVINVNLTQKEKTLLKDQKSHEEICIEKYTNYAQQAQDPELKNLFNSYADQERQHLNTINQILSGSVPQTGGNSQGNQQGSNQNMQQSMQNQNSNQASKQNMQQSQNQSQNQGNQAGMTNQKDAKLCTDLLMTEKYVSGTYDTAIFECTDSNIRSALNHIQKEEQQHGEGIFNYMQNNGMYNPQ